MGLLCMLHSYKGISRPAALQSMQLYTGPQRALQARQHRQMAAETCVRKAYVGQSTPLAGEYHSRDYDWAEHALQTAAIVEAQWAAAPEGVRQKALLSSTGQTLSAVAQMLQQLKAQQPEGNGKHSGCRQTSSSCTQTSSSSRNQENGQIWLHDDVIAASNPIGIANRQERPGCQQCLGSNSEHSNTASQYAEGSAPDDQTQENEWETFYKAHPTAKFFKERRYLLLEFPCLAPPAQLRHVVEIGAGCGSSLLPILRAQPGATATATDVSSTCLDQLSNAVKLLGLNPERCKTLVADGTDPALGSSLTGCNADVALIMFTLSAVLPEGMLVMIQNAAAALRPGGLLCIRDHALYDMVQLRIPAEQCIGRHLYKRGDDTLAYFYTLEDLSGLAEAAGLEVLECEYVCVVNRNRKTGQELRRAFVHGRFRRPEVS